MRLNDINFNLLRILLKKKMYKFAHYISYRLHIKRCVIMEIIKSREKYRGCNVTLNTDLVVKGFEDEIGKKG